MRSVNHIVVGGRAGRLDVPPDLLDERGDTWAEAELAWEERRVALSSRSQVQRAHGQPADGWRVFLIEDLAGDPSPLLSALR